jgi:tetratricopeptide (TPR) repeat protein
MYSAFPALEAALRLRPDWVAALQTRGELLLETGRGADALRDFDRILRLAPDSFAAFLGRARALRAEKRLPEAEAAATEALKLQAGDPAALLLRARTRFEQGRHQDAVSDLERVADSGPSPETLELLAQARLKAGQAVQAERDFRRLLEHHPGRTAAWKGLAEALVAQGQGREALAAYRSYLTQAPADVATRVDVARLLYAKPSAAWFDAAAAVALAREADGKAQGANPQARLALAEALMAAGQEKEALEVIEQAYTRFPADPDIQAGRERLRREARTTPKK